MKLLISVLAFVATIALTTSALAEEGHGGGHGNLAEKMNSLFPKKEAQNEKRDTPSKPELVAPEFYSKVSGDRATLQWKAVTGAEEYHVQVATDPNFKWLVTNEHHVSGTSFEATGLEAGKQYYWRVAAFKGTNWSTFRKGFFASSMFTTSVK
jgi:hypothetical protein